MKRLKVVALLALNIIPWMVQAQQCQNINCRDTTLCINAPPFQLKLCTPEGGYYYGKGIVDFAERTYKAEQAKAGVDTLIYIINSDTCHLHITVIGIPKPGNVFGNNKVCKGETVTYQTKEFKDSDSFIWTFNSQSFTTVQSQLNLAINSNYISGSLTVKGKNATCDEGPSSTGFPITVNNTPSPLIQGIANDSIEVCINARVNYASTNDYATYKWTLEESDDTIVSPDILKTVTVYWKGDFGNELKLTVTDIEGCIGDTTIKILKSGEAPKPAEIWIFGENLLVCSDSTATTYNWYRKGQTVPLGTLFYYYVDNIAVSDTFYVETCKDACCNNSDLFSFYGKKGNGKNALVETNFSIYPNPASDKLTIRKMVPFADKYSYYLIDMYGKLQSSGYGSGLETTIDISQLAAGMYFIRIDDGLSLKEVYKIIITR